MLYFSNDGYEDYWLMQLWFISGGTWVNLYQKSDCDFDFDVISLYDYSMLKDLENT